MRVAMLGHKRIPSREGGIEIVVEELSTRMVKRGNSITVYNRMGHHVSGNEYDKERLKEYRGIRIKRALTIDAKGLAAVSASFFGSIACALGKYDVVHFHAEGPAFMCGLPKLFGKRVIVTIHGLDWKRAKWGKFASWYIMKGERMAASHADEIIVLSKAVKDYFKEQYNRETTLIPNGVTLPELREPQIIADKYGLKKDEYILFLGRLVPEKGVHYLIDAYKRIETHKKLVIAGGSSDTTEYMKELKHRADGSNGIIFTGFVEGPELEELYSNAYFYVLPSDVAGMPLSLLEAMSYGKACLTSDIPECTDVIEDPQMCFEHGNIPDLARKMDLLINNKSEVDERAKHAFETVRTKYSWDDVTDKTLALYNIQRL